MPLPLTTLRESLLHQGNQKQMVTPPLAHHILINSSLGPAYKSCKQTHHTPRPTDVWYPPVRLKMGSTFPMSKIYFSDRITMSIHLPARLSQPWGHPLIWKSPNQTKISVIICDCNFEMRHYRKRFLQYFSSVKQCFFSLLNTLRQQW